MNKGYEHCTNDNLKICSKAMKNGLKVRFCNDKRGSN